MSDLVNNEYNCDICDKTFKTARGIQVHKYTCGKRTKVVKEVKEVKVNVIEPEIIEQTEIIDIIPTKHSTVNKTSTVCFVCTRDLETEKKLYVHKVKCSKKIYAEDIKDSTHLCSLCGKVAANARGLNVHRNSCIKKFDDYELTNCRFCNIESSLDKVFDHEQDCTFRKEFSPYNFCDNFNYYKHILNYDPTIRVEFAECRHCDATVKTSILYEHERRCDAKVTHFIGPVFDKVQCEHCDKHYYTENIITDVLLGNKVYKKLSYGINYHQKYYCKSNSMKRFRPKYNIKREQEREYVEISECIII